MRTMQRKEIVTKKVFRLIAALGLLTSTWVWNESLHAVQLYVDSAPNRYGSTKWGSWWDQTKADVAAGSFVNLRTGTHPGTLVIDPYDEIVYSTMDLGKRLHWIYWIPDATKENLQGKFQVKWVIDWDGDNWTYDWANSNWLEDGAEKGWIEPSSWENYNDGVIGTFGFAWWATDDEAKPYDTDSNPYNETDQADIDALRCAVFGHQTFAEGYVRIRNDSTRSWDVDSLRVTVPDSGNSLALLGIAFVGMAGLYRRIEA
ncbi:MAG: hypothetical protein ACP5MD_09685 [Verrucomicrobiia bacterium]